MDITTIEAMANKVRDENATAMEVHQFSGWVLQLVEKFKRLPPLPPEGARERLTKAIMTFTADRDRGCMPNRNTENAMVLLTSAIGREDLKDAKTAYGLFCELLADDTTELREAADRFFGRSFLVEPNHDDDIPF